MELQSCLNGGRLNTTMAEPLNVNWVAIREAAIAGVPFKILAAQNGLYDKKGKPYTGAIRVRAMREKWPVVTRLVHEAKKQAKRANEARDAAMKMRQSLNPSMQTQPSDTYVHRDRETSIGDIEPGLPDLGFMGDSPLNQGIQLHGNGNQGSREAGIRGDSSGIRGFDDSQVPGFGDESVSRELRIGEGSEGSLSIGKVGNSGNMMGGQGIDASSSLQASESTAATLIQNHMATLAQESIIQALQRAHASIHAAPSQLPIATITDLRSAAKLTMELTGMDKQSNTTNLAILVSPTPKAGTWNFHDSPESLTIDAE